MTIFFDGIEWGLLAFEQSAEIGRISYKGTVKGSRKHFLKSEWHRTKPGRTALFHEHAPDLARAVVQSLAKKPVRGVDWMAK